MEKKEIKKEVRKKYSEIARTSGACGCSAQIGSCCGSTNSYLSKRIGYSETELSAIPKSADLGLGCGNPTANASIKEGQTVIDLGSGAGIDCFLAAQKVGRTGKVIGIDMTPEMVSKARENAKKGNYSNVEFRLGEIENIPVEDNSADIIISNCVINLSPDKEKVFKETFRVLKSGGKLFISDLVLLKKLPEVIKNSIEAYTGCISGAVSKSEYLNAIKEAGFKDVEILSETNFPVENMANDATVKAVLNNSKASAKDIENIANSVASIKVTAQKY